MLGVRAARLERDETDDALFVMAPSLRVRLLRGQRLRLEAS